jgi:protoporphyrinogen oxidase
MTSPRPPAATTCDSLVLGAGLSGLAAAHGLGTRALVLEQDERPGGLARSETIDGYLFDHAIHVLYFPDEATRARVFALADHHLAPCPPEAWVETAHGVARFPIQLHLGGLDPVFVERCVGELERVLQAPPGDDARDFEELLLRSFGRELCELFFFPYNRKVWKRPLSELAPSGFQWNIVRPDLAQVLRGAREKDASFRSYNSDGWYPRSARGAPQRGIEVLSQALARGADIRLGRRVVAIDPTRREVTAQHEGVLEHYRYERACIATLPLPQVVAMCAGLPAKVTDACRSLPRNRVVSVALAVRGERPAHASHWRYYADESVVFNRLIWPHAFDPLAAPPDGFGLLAEITEPAESLRAPDDQLIERVRADAVRVGALPSRSQVLGARAWVLDPAYVVFQKGGQEIIRQARAALEEAGISTLGRYGRWEYSSMAQVMRDGFAEADRLLAMGPRP